MKFYNVPLHIESFDIFMLWNGGCFSFKNDPIGKIFDIHLAPNDLDLFVYTIFILWVVVIFLTLFLWYVSNTLYKSHKYSKLDLNQDYLDRLRSL